MIDSLTHEKVEYLLDTANVDEAFFSTKSEENFF